MPLTVACGTRNPTKIGAVRETLAQYFQEVEICEYDVDSGVGGQPMTLEPIVLGAKNRALQAFKMSSKTVDVAFGIESGLYRLTTVVETEDPYDGWFDVCVCSCFDGRVHHLGTSCSFQVPPKIMKYVLDNGVELSEACFKSGITANAKLGSAEGLIGILTGGRIKRLDYTKQALACSMIALENKGWF
jgi:inosine/xanthosine triphosphatase